MAAIHDAAKSGDVEKLERLLLSDRTIVNDLDESGCSTLYWATLEGHAKAVSVLLAYGAHVNLPDPSGHTPLYSALVHYNSDIATILLDAGGTAEVNTPPGFGSELLCNAIDEYTTAMVEILLRAGVKPDALALSRATCPNKNQYLYETELFLQAGLHPDNEYCELHFAAEQADTEMVGLLLRYGANVNRKDHELYDQTPLHRAAITDDKDGAAETARRLISAGAELSAKDKNGWTPIDLAALNNNMNVIDVLLAHDVRPTDEVLLAGVRMNNVPIVRKCLAADCNVNYFDTSGNTALHYAATNNFDPNGYDGAYVGGASIAEQILEDGGFDLGIRNNKRETVLNIALERHFDQMTRLLRWYGDEPDGDDLSLLQGLGRLEWFESLPVKNEMDSSIP